MDDGHRKVLQTMRGLCRFLTIIMVAAVMVSWFVWGSFGLLFYTGGLFNSSLAFVLFVLLSSMAPLLVICASALVVYTAFRWSRLNAWRKGRCVVAAIVLLAWPVSYGLESRGVIPTHVPFDLFARGLARYVTTTGSRATTGAVP